MQITKQDRRNEALKLVLDLSKKAGTHAWQQDQGYREMVIARAEFDYQEAQGKLLTFIDELIDGHGFSKHVQACIDEFNEREAEQLRRKEVVNARKK